jgi:hypothetical protein
VAFPLRGRRVPEFNERTDLREIFFEQFRIVYKVIRYACRYSHGAPHVAVNGSERSG